MKFDKLYESTMKNLKTRLQSHDDKMKLADTVYSVLSAFLDEGTSVWKDKDNLKYTPAETENLQKILKQISQHMRLFETKQKRNDNLDKLDDIIIWIFDNELPDVFPLPHNKSKGLDKLSEIYDNLKS